MRTHSLHAKLGLAILLTAAGSLQGQTPRLAIQGDMDPGGHYRVALTAEILRAFTNGLDDLVVVDEMGEEWLARRWRPAHGEGSRSLMVVREAMDVAPAPGKPRSVRVRVDSFGLEDAEPVHNRVSVHTSGQGYTRRVDVIRLHADGSEENLGSGYLIDRGGIHPVTLRSVDYTPATGRHLRIDVHPDTSRSEPDAYIINSVHVAYAPLFSAPASELVIDQDSARWVLDSATGGVIVDLGPPALTVQSVALEGDVEGLILPVALWGGAEGAAGFTPIGSGAWYELPFGSRSLFTLDGSELRRLRLEPAGPSPESLPLVSIRVTVLTEFLLLTAGSGRRPVLTARPSSDPEPDTHLGLGYTEDEIMALPLLRLEQPKRRIAALSVVSGEWLQGLGIAALAIAAIGIIAWLWRLSQEVRSLD